MKKKNVKIFGGYKCLQMLLLILNVYIFPVGYYDITFGDTRSLCLTVGYQDITSGAIKSFFSQVDIKILSLVS